MHLLRFPPWSWLHVLRALFGWSIGGDGRLRGPGATVVERVGAFGVASLVIPALGLGSGGAVVLAALFAALALMVAFAAAPLPIGLAAALRLVAVVVTRAVTGTIGALRGELLLRTRVVIQALAAARVTAWQLIDALIARIGLVHVSILAARRMSAQGVVA